MKLAVALVALVVLLGGKARAADGLRAELSLDGQWQSLQTRERSDAPPEGEWRSFTVPGTAYGTAEGGSTYLWLRREVAVPAEWQGQRIFLNLMGARYDPHVYVDGKPMGSRLGGWSPFEVEITDAIQPGSTHRVEVRCQDWGATFVDGFVLPEGGWNDDNAKRGKVMAPIGGHIAFYGPWDSIELVARPEVYLADHVVIPSVRKATLTIEGSLSGQAAGLWVDAEVIEGERTVLQTPAEAVGTNGTWEIGAAFPGAHCWSPEDPHLYDLRVHLRRGRAGDPVDTLEQRLGFKEFWTEGPDFYLNGVKRHLLATSTWPPPRPESTEFVRNAIEHWKAAHCVAFRQHTQPWRKEWTEMADEMGIMMIIEAAMWTDSGYHAYEDERFWDEYRDHLKRMVRRDRNSASVVMWSLENEFLSVGNDRWFPDLEKRLAEMGVFVKALDPHHPIFFESDLDPGGVADVIGLHYPHELPNHADYPNAADWLQKRKETEAGGGLLGTVSRDFFWDRQKPLYIGEYLWVPTEDHSPGTVFFGDEAFVDRNRYNLLAKALAWYDQTIAYRRAGVSGLCPWTFSFPRGDRPREDPLFRAQRDAYVPVAAYLRDRDTRFFTGDTVARTFDVFNDSPEPQELELRWELTGTDEGGAETFELPPAGYTEISVDVELPATTRPRDLGFRTVLLADGEQVHSQSAVYRIEPRMPLRTPEGTEVLLYDPDGGWAGRLAEEGLGGRTLATLEALGAAGTGSAILVIAPGALQEKGAPAGPPQVGRESPVAAHLAAFVARGGRVLVMEQDTLAPLPVPGKLVDHASTMTFALAPTHPVLGGLDAGDLRFWRGDNYVSRKEIRRPVAGGARTVVVSGGDQALAQGPIVELAAGDGRIVLIQALVGEKLNAEPVARRLLQNALDYLADLEPAPEPTVAVTASGGSVEGLRQLGVEVSAAGLPQIPADSRGRGLVALHGAPTAEAAALAEAHLRAGGTVYWHTPEAAAFAAAAESLGIGGARIAPAEGPVSIIERDHPLLAAVSREDLFFTGPHKSWRRDADVDTTVIDRAIVPDDVGEDAEQIALDSMELTGRYVSVQGDRIGFGTNGTATTEIEVGEAGRYVVTVVATGTPAAGVNPLCAVRVNDVQAGLISAVPGGFRRYPVLVDLPAGRSKLTIAFVNDRFVDGEDRNLHVQGVLVGRRPWAAEGIEILTQPAALAVIGVGTGRLVIDGVRWDNNDQNRIKGARYASAVLANLGARFQAPEAEPDWVPWTAFEQVGEYPYFGKRNGVVSLFAGGAIAAPFECLQAGVYEVFIHGRSTPAGGEFAKMEVSVDGRAIGEVELNASSDRSFSVGRASLVRGAHTVSARFTNDLQVGGQDRNVWVREIGFRAVAR